MLFIRDTLKYKDTDGLKVKGWDKIYHRNTKGKNSGLNQHHAKQASKQTGLPEIIQGHLKMIRVNSRRDNNPKFAPHNRTSNI